MIGNNVRFAGIDVGTVQRIEIISDTLVKVTMVLDNKVLKFIHKNAVASVGTDGLMGNKLININSQSISIYEVFFVPFLKWRNDTPHKP